MADVTWGVKVPEELKEQINRLMKESGLQGKDFMQQIINAYIVEMAKVETPEIAQDLKELQSLTQRINDIYLNMGYRIENLYEGQKRKTDQLLDKKDEIINEMHDELEASRDKYENLVKLYNEKNNSINDLCKDIERLTENNQNLKALNEEYKKNISDLEKKLQVFKDAIGEIEQLKAENTAITDEKQALSIQLAERDALIRELKDQLEHIEASHKEDLRLLKQNFDMERAKLALELEKEHLEQSEKIKKEYQKAIERQELKEENIKISYDRRINELMAMYRDLSLQILKVEEEEKKEKKGD